MTNQAAACSLQLMGVNPTPANINKILQPFLLNIQAQNQHQIIQKLITPLQPSKEKQIFFQRGGFLGQITQVSKQVLERPSLHIKPSFQSTNPFISTLDNTRDPQANIKTLHKLRFDDLKSESTNLINIAIKDLKSEHKLGYPSQFMEQLKPTLAQRIQQIKILRNPFTGEVLKSRQ